MHINIKNHYFIFVSFKNTQKFPFLFLLFTENIKQNIEMKKNLKLKKITNLKNEKQLLLDFFVNIIFRDRISSMSL